MIKVLVVDDHHIVRAGLKGMLEGSSGIKIVGEASSGEEAVKLVKEMSPDVVLMDIRMPGIGGLEATRKIIRSNPDTKVLVLSVYEDDVFPSKLLQAGALGYLTKGSTNQDELQRAVRSVHLGQRFMSSEIARQLALRHLDDRSDSPFEVLSDRELQVGMMIISAEKVQKIADKLCLSTKTVNSYRYRIFAKLGIASDVELTRLAIKHRLLEDLPEESQDILTGSSTEDHHEVTTD